MYKIERYHDISCGHRVVGHEGKCRHLHGHNYRITFVCQAGKLVDGYFGDADTELDSVGRVIDFSEVKSRLCMWVEDNWDHKFLAYEGDDFMIAIEHAIDAQHRNDSIAEFASSVVWVPFNPTAEQMASYLVEVVGPQQLAGTGIELVECRVEETRKCSATFVKDSK